ncbi:MAG: ROK family glucokinase [Lachnospiraceae bacterium]|nr:ROK family glucokinase [Lachnospiraceae bacterium]
MEKLCFGVDVGGTTIKMGLFTTEGKLVDKWEIVTRKEDNGSHIPDDITLSINNKIQEKNIDRSNVSGIGIGVPGPVKEDGTVLKCVNLGWGIINISQILHEKTGFNIKAGNDANVAALGEMWQGGGKGYKNLVMITLGTGVGGGIILNENILTGVNGAAGEIGHMPVVYDETETCGCGKKGCLEQVASATGIVKEAKKILASTDEPSSLKNMENISAKNIFDEAKKGDKLACEAVDRLCTYLGIASAHIACVVDPEVFVIGGGVSKAGEILTENIQKKYVEKAFPACREAKFELAKLGNDAGIYGAAKLVL